MNWPIFTYFKNPQAGQNPSENLQNPKYNYLILRIAQHVFLEQDGTLSDYMSLNAV